MRSLSELAASSRKKSDPRQEVQNSNRRSSKVSKVRDVATRAANNLEQIEANVANRNPLEFNRNRNKHQVHLGPGEIHRGQCDKPQNTP